MLSSITELMVDVNSPIMSVIIRVLVEKDIATVVAGVDNYVWRYS
jgi:hypothetical protein